MLIRHVSRLLSAYDAGELDPRKAHRVADHLQRCPRCRRHYDTMRSTAALVSSLPHVSAPDHLWNRIEARLQMPAADAADTAGKFMPRSARLRMTLLCVAPMFVGIALLIVWRFTRPPHIQVTVVDGRPFWNIARLNGAPTVGGYRG